MTNFGGKTGSLKLSQFSLTGFVGRLDGGNGKAPKGKGRTGESLHGEMSSSDPLPQFPMMALTRKKRLCSCSDMEAHALQRHSFIITRL